MSVVLDASVLVSGILITGHLHTILRGWRDGTLHLLLSPEILDEYARVAGELAAEFPGVELSCVLRLVTAHGAFVEAGPLRGRVCADPGDDRFLACAVASPTNGSSAGTPACSDRLGLSALDAAAATWPVPAPLRVGHALGRVRP